MIDTFLNPKNATQNNSMQAVAPAKRSVSVWSYPERLLMEALADNKTLTQAAAKAKMSMREAAIFTARSDVTQAIHAIRRAYLLGELQPRALQTARDILDDDEASSATRAKLAMSVLAFNDKIEAGEIGRPPALDEMAPEDLIAIAEEMRSQALTIEHEPPSNPQAQTESELF